MALVKNVSHASAHSGGEISSCAAKNNRNAACHIFKSVVAAAFRHSGGSGVSHAKALAGHAVYEGLSACRAKEGDVSDDDVFVGASFKARGLFDDKLSAA